MYIDPSLIPSFWQWLALGVALTSGMIAVISAPWTALLNVPLRQHLAFASILGLSVAWSLSVKVAGEVSFHLLLLATAVLVFGPGLALINGLFALVLVTAFGEPVWASFGINSVCGILVPVASAYGTLKLSRKISVAPGFAYILGAGFIGGGLSVAAVAVFFVGLLWLMGQGEWVLVALENATLLPLLMFPEGFINGTLITGLVVHFPEWVRTFDEPG